MSKNNPHKQLSSISFAQLESSKWRSYEKQQWSVWIQVAQIYACITIELLSSWRGERIGGNELDAVSVGRSGSAGEKEEGKRGSK